MSIILCRAQSALKAAQGNLEQAVVYCMDPASIPSSPEQQAAAAESQNVNVMILGATGPQAQVVNGIFKPTPTLQNGHLLYRKQEDGKEDSKANQEATQEGTVLKEPISFHDAHLVTELEGAASAEALNSARESTAGWS